MTIVLPVIIYRLFAAGIEKCPNHVPLYQAWACLELRDGDVITAKRLISEALTRDKRNGSGWLVAAQIEEKMGNHGLVGLILRRGIECAPGDMELYRALAENEISRGKIDSVSRRLCCLLLHPSTLHPLTCIVSFVAFSRKLLGPRAARKGYRN